ncbi:MAG: cupredoxin domain-containing protein [Vicingaceae bacterium]|nr:cupredoxin domain-containing protein [Flavobacteriales bacterium]MDF1674704.1 cupredoxin domain-containing protein [Vicingaceae bacterium]
MRTHLKRITVVGFIFYGLISCSKHDDSDQGANEIRLEYKEFHPFQLSVKSGTSVLFKNTGGGGTHSVTGNLFNSGKIKVDEAYSYTFNTIRRYSFYCSYHSDNSQERVAIIVE